jgi:bacterioferritin-associated ferredoxin
MYICVCNRVTDRDIRAAVAAGHRGFHEIQDVLGVATCCGRCADCARGEIAAASRQHHAACAEGGDD